MLSIDKSKKEIVYESYFAQHRFFVFFNEHEQLKVIQVFDLFQKGECLSFDEKRLHSRQILEMKSAVSDPNQLYSVKDTKALETKSHFTSETVTHAQILDKIRSIRPSQNQVHLLDFIGTKQSPFSDIKKQYINSALKSLLMSILRTHRNSLNKEWLNDLAELSTKNVNLFDFDKKITTIKAKINKLDDEQELINLLNDSSRMKSASLYSLLRELEKWFN